MFKLSRFVAKIDKLFHRKTDTNAHNDLMSQIKSEKDPKQSKLLSRLSTCHTESMDNALSECSSLEKKLAHLEKKSSSTQCSLQTISDLPEIQKTCSDNSGSSTFIHSKNHSKRSSQSKSYNVQYQHQRKASRQSACYQSPEASSYSLRSTQIQLNSNVRSMEQVLLDMVMKVPMVQDKKVKKHMTQASRSTQSNVYQLRKVSKLENEPASRHEKIQPLTQHNLNQHEQLATLQHEMLTHTLHDLNKVLYSSQG